MSSLSPQEKQQLFNCIQEAESNIQNANIHKAIALFEQALQIFPLLPRTLRGLAHCYYLQKNIPKSVKTWMTLLQAHPKDQVTMDQLWNISQEYNLLDISIYTALHAYNQNVHTPAMLYLLQIHDIIESTLPYVILLGTISTDVQESLQKHHYKTIALPDSFLRNFSTKQIITTASVQRILESLPICTVLYSQHTPHKKAFQEACALTKHPLISYGDAEEYLTYGTVIKTQDIGVLLEQLQANSLGINKENVGYTRKPLHVYSIQTNSDTNVQHLQIGIALQSYPCQAFGFNFLSSTESTYANTELYSPFFHTKNMDATGKTLPSPHLQSTNCIAQYSKENINVPLISFDSNNLQPRSKAPVCALIRGYKNTEKTARCIRSIRHRYSVEQVRIVYVDNGSDIEDFITLLREFPDVEFMRFPQNFGSCRGINSGMVLGSLEKHEYYLILDNDAWAPEEDPTWLERWMAVFKRDKIGGVGATSFYTIGAQSIEKCPETYMRSFKRPNGSSGSAKLIEVPILITFAVMYKREALEDVGWFVDEVYEPGNCEDSDLALRVQEKGWKLSVAQSVWIHHEGSQTFNDNNKNNVLSLTLKNRKTLIHKFGQQRLCDLDFDHLVKSSNQL